MCLYVDDIAIHATGTAAAAAECLTSSISASVEVLEEQLAMRVSRRQPWSSTGAAKTVAAASSLDVAKRISTTMRRLGILVCRKAKHLGACFAPGARTRDQRGGGSRWAKLSKKRARVQKLGRRLGAHVFKTGIQPAALYGASVAVPKLGVVRSMRRTAARTIGEVQGRSVTARLTIHRCDPAVEAIKRPAMAWVNAIWDSQVPVSVMQRAWMQAHIIVARSLRPSMSAGGVAGSLAAIQRIGWTSPSYDSVRTEEGAVLNLSVIAPKTVFRFLVDDYLVSVAAGTKVLYPSPP